MSPDVVIVGGGMSGLAAGVALAEGGASVLVVAKGAGSLQLAPGTIDLLGYSDQRVTDPLSAIAALAERDPGHPYALLGADAVADATRWLSSRVIDGPLAPYRYVGSPEENLLLPTAIGVPRPSALVPETMAAGDLRQGGRIVIVGFRGMKDFHPALIAENLTRATAGAVSARATQIDPPVGLGGEAGTLRLARSLDQPGAADTLATRLAAVVQDGEVLALPAVLSIRDPHGVWETLQRRVGRPVFEIPTLPPSVPGLRLFDTLRTLLRRAGGRLVTGSYVVGTKGSGDRVEAVRVHVSGGERTYPTRWVVLATGGVASGGLELDADWRMRETALGLDVAGVPAPRAPRFSSRYLDAHPLGRAGVAADHDLRPLNADGTRRWDNVLVVGASLAGAQPWREKSGEGIALTSGHRAAQLILDAQRSVPDRSNATTTAPEPVA
jgi:glycerol-3-phosphate dehydrogenase subunit B